MNTDKNTVIGFVLLAGLFFMYFWYTNKQQTDLATYKKHFDDSVAMVKATAEKAAALQNPVKLDSTAGAIANNIDTVKEEFTYLENEVVKVKFSNKGGQVAEVTLKKYTNYKKELVKLGDSSSLNYPINIGDNKVLQVNHILFPTKTITAGEKGAQKIEYAYTTPAGKTIRHQFTLEANKYNIDWNIQLEGADQLLTNQQLNVIWDVHSYQQERTSTYERQMSNICFSEGGGFDYISSKTTKAFEKPIQWVGLVQQFFATTLISKDGFASGNLNWQRKIDSTHGLAALQSQLQTKVAGANATVAMSLYYGPNDFSILKSQAPEMEKIVNLGRDLYSFVRPINKYILMPVFDFIAGFVNNFGWVIFFLTIFIRVVTSPLTYSSYLSSAKMKVLKPELDEIKKKLGDDQQGFAMEQMKLFREAGVNPLGGCIPALLQIPIFFALYSFFNSNISLRGQSFLWSHDLSSYDSIYTLPFTVPMGFGNHLSLFTLTAVITSLIMSVYNMAMTPTQDNPALKYMPYIFPFMLLFIFNGLPSALTWYYTVSNVITLLMQLVIQKFIINHDKILAGIEVKRKTPKKKSNWQSKYEQMMESQKKIQALKDKTKK
ncbi:MAG: membrane protein insertase YidC [Bacteroidetes bacterium]|nr:membrane protein insertase YidC [Bacteroidota bacterium]